MNSEIDAEADCRVISDFNTEYYHAHEKYL